MNEFLSNWPVFQQAILDTLFMVIIAVIASGVLGLAMGIGLYATRPGNLLENAIVFNILNVIVNIIRPIPFVIFVSAIAPVTISVIGTNIGTPAVTFAMSLAAAFAVSRIVEQNLVAVNPGVIEAARAAGASNWSILFSVVLREGLGPLILGYTFIFVGVVDMSAQAGLVGGGGLGDYAITYGLQRSNYQAMYITVVIIIIIVQLGQFLGNWLSRKAMRR